MNMQTTTSFRALSTIAASPVQWLWGGRIPLGALTLLDGDPGAGKSTLTYDLAARVTQGGVMPFADEAVPPAGVVLVQAEDQLDSAVRPRLEAAGADLDRVLVYDREQAVARPLVLPEGADLLAAEAQRIGAKLIVIDPLSAFVSRSSVSEHGARSALEPLITLARRQDLAVVVVRHLTKSAASRALRRGLGSMGAIAAARAGLYAAPDPTSDDPSRRVLALSKGSLGSAPSLAYRTYQDDCGVLRIAWLAETAQSADELAGGESEPSALEEAVAFLRQTLRAGPMPASEVLTLAKAAAIAERTLRRAKAAMKVRSRPQGSGPDAQWCWSPPPGAGDPEAAGRRRDVEPSSLNDSSRAQETQGSQSIRGALARTVAKAGAAQPQGAR